MKYDCNNSLDMIHEFKRLCRCYLGHNRTCANCPLDNEYGCDMEHFGEKEIELIQKWSDEHPEKPKLKPYEASFIRAFDRNHYDIDKLGIKRQHYTKRVILYNHDPMANRPMIHINPGWFNFIEDGVELSIEELLTYEVEEDDDYR